MLAIFFNRKQNQNVLTLTVRLPFTTYIKMPSRLAWLKKLKIGGSPHSINTLEKVS